MKYKLLAAAAALSMSAGCQALDNTAAPKVTELGIAEPHVALLVGNSFSFYNCGVHGYLRGLNKNASPEIPWKMRMTTTTSATLSLHPLEQYLGFHEQEPYSESKKDGEPKFDVVILQAHSAAATSAKRIPYFEKYAVIDAGIIRARGAIPVLVMTWAPKDKPDLIGKLSDTTIEIGNKAGMMVVPVGLAFAEAMKGRPDIELIMADKRHPTAAGSYLYGAVLHSALFRRSPEGNPFAGECEKPLDPETSAYLQKVAWETVKTFYGWQQ